MKGKFKMLKAQILEIYEGLPKNQSITTTAKQIAEKLEIEYDDSLRRMLSKWIEKDPDLENTTFTETNQYETESLNNLPSAWCKDLQKFLTIEEFCDRYGLDKSAVKSSKLVSHNVGHMTYNIAFYTLEEEAVLNVNEHLEEIIKKYIEPTHIQLNYNAFDNTDTFDRLVYTDVHIGMSVQGNGDPLYDGVWDKQELLRRLALMVNHVIGHQSSDIIYIDDLGDFLDGLGGQTTRKGHSLPQNLNDKQSFDLALEFKVGLVEMLLPYYKEIICNDITEDNHAGVFGYFVSSSVKGILEGKYPDRVTVNSRKRFIENYSVGKHTFVLCHGKDSESLKFGFKPVLDTKQAEKIDQYCKENKLYNGNFIEFSKGDSHQGLFDDTTSNDFQYYSYPAFSPPSNWVKTSFKNSKSGFRFYNISKEENIKIAIPYYFL